MIQNIPHLRNVWAPPNRSRFGKTRFPVKTADVYPASCRGAYTIVASLDGFSPLPLQCPEDIDATTHQA